MNQFFNEYSVPMARRARTFSEKSLFSLFEPKEPPDETWKNHLNSRVCSSFATKLFRRKGSIFGSFSLDFPNSQDSSTLYKLTSGTTKMAKNTGSMLAQSSSIFHILFLAEKDDLE
jgi:hypothetical protein